MSLRARLVATLLALATAGLLVLGAITYASQRSYLDQRLDDQTTAALGAARFALGHDGDDQRGSGIGGPPPGARPDPNRANLPPGTYIAARTPDGRTLGRVLGYGERLSAPRLPRHWPEGLFTVPSRDGSLSYRVRTARGPDDALDLVALPVREVEQTLHRLLFVEGLVILGVLAVLAGVSWLLVRAGLRPLERMGTTAGAIAGGDLARRVDDANPRTEVGRLGLALNAMLGRLEGAFAERRASEERLRRFLADASHELRTPLTAIRGYAEVFRMGAAARPEDTAKAMRRIEDEAARMGVLVEDLLTLARLDEVRPAAREAVDLAALAVDAVADARAVDPDRPLAAEGEAPALVLGDADQLRQVVSNLLRNALVHTPARTPVEVTTKREGGAIVLEVRDHGPGLPAGDPVALFGRFWRAEAGRGRGRAGAGLGLAIVAGIVHAHGGEVAAADAEGGGAVFTVRLPAAPPAPSLSGEGAQRSAARAGR